MKIAIASGKGGTGKTTVATNLAVSLSRSGIESQYVDCDVEEPDGHIFLKPVIENRVAVGIPVPLVNDDKCTGCGECGMICQYSAIVCIGKKVLTFHELCHGCGGCLLVCPEGAITEVRRDLGIIENGMSSGVRFMQGRLRVGEAMAAPLIKQVKKRLVNGIATVLDSPPGTSCPVMHTMRGSDYVVLVTEPRPFGLNDLTLAVETTRQLQLPFGVVINRCDAGDDSVRRYCSEENIDVLLEIRDERRITEAYSEGKLAIDVVPELEAGLVDMYEAIRKKTRE